MQNIIALACFVFVASLTWLFARMLLRPRPRSPSLLDRLSGQTVPDVADEDDSDLVVSLAAQLPYSPADNQELDKDLRRAGRYGPNARKRFLALRNGLSILAILATGVLVVAIGPAHKTAAMRTLALGCVVAVVAYSLPRLMLAIQAKRRMEQICSALPDALDTISMCLHGGISLRECLGYVGREMRPVHPDLALELLIVDRQTNINSFDFAMTQFANRIDAPEIVALASLVTQNQRLGTGIVESLGEYADNLRLKRRQMAETKAGRAELFLLFPVIFCLIPSIVILLYGPPILSLIDFIQGPASPIRMGR
jgi:tight adherence protein C